MRPIITPALVRRYLLATGNELRPSERRAFDERPDDYQRLVGIIGQRIGPGPAELCARLGMLAAAEDAEAQAVAIETDKDLDLSADEPARCVRDEMRGRARRYVVRAGVDPEAWEKARGA